MLEADLLHEDRRETELRLANVNGDMARRLFHVDVDLVAHAARRKNEEPQLDLDSGALLAVEERRRTYHITRCVVEEFRRAFLSVRPHHKRSRSAARGLAQFNHQSVTAN